MTALQRQHFLGGELGRTGIKHETLVEAKLQAGVGRRMLGKPHKRVENTFRLAHHGEIVGNCNALDAVGLDGVVEQADCSNTEEGRAADATLTDTLLAENGVDELALVEEEEQGGRGVGKMSETPE